MIFLHHHRLLLLLSISTACLSVIQAQLVDPAVIQTCETESTQITVQVPASTETEPVDVFFLFDDTGTFARASSQLANQFSALVAELTAAFPNVDFGFGVGKFEDFGGPGTDYGGLAADSRPAILNQPIVTLAELDDDIDALNTLVTDALRRTAPQNGGDIPESAIEGLYQMAAGTGFDGNGDGSFLGLDGAQVAGATATQTAPDASGDVPNAGSLDASVLSAGSVGGGLFRPNSQKLLILATDACTVAPFAGEIPETVTSSFGTEPAEEFSCAAGVRFGVVGDALVKADSTLPRSIAPQGAHTVVEAIDALVAAGIRVMGLSPTGGATPTGSGPSDNPSVFLSAVARLTGAVDADGNALVTQINVNDATALQAAILNAISTFVAPPINVEVSPQGCESIDGLTLSFDPATAEEVAPGSNVTFEVSFDIDPEVASGSCELQFVDGTGAVLATGAVQLDVCLETESPSVQPTSAPSPAATTGTPSDSPVASSSPAPTSTPSISPTAAVSVEGPTVVPTDAPSLPPVAGPTAVPTGTPTDAPSLPAVVGPTAAPSSEPSNQPTISSRPSSSPTSEAPVRRPPPMSLFWRVKNVKGSSTGRHGSIHFDFTPPMTGKGSTNACWGFNCGDGESGGQGSYSKGNKGGKGKGGKGGGSHWSKSTKGGKGKGGSHGGKGSYTVKGGKGGKGSKGNDSIFESIFDPVINNANRVVQMERLRDRHARMKALRRQRIRERKMSMAMSMTMAMEQTAAGIVRRQPDQFIVVSDLTVDESEARARGIFFVSNQLLRDESNAGRRKTVEGQDLV